LLGLGLGLGIVGLGLVRLRLVELGLRFRPSEQRTFGRAQFLTHFNDVLFPAYLLTSPKCFIQSGATS